MKKIVYVLIAIFIILFLFGCNSSKLNTYESVTADSVNDGIGIKREVNYWTGEYFIKDNMSDKSCSVGEEKYIGSYVRSIVDTMNSYTTDIYMTVNNIEFGLRSDNKKLAYINFMNGQFLETEPFLNDIENPQETALAVSEKIAKLYVNNFDEYICIEEEPRIRQKEKNGKVYTITYYVTTYAKKVNGYFSSDYISIKVTSKGHLASIMTGDIGAFENNSLEFDKQLVQESINNKVSTAYKDAKIQIDTFDIDYQRIVVTPNGEVCIFSDVIVKGFDTSNQFVNTGIRILTAVGNKN